jgi:ParB family chromosome partitioning protein
MRLEIIQIERIVEDPDQPRRALDDAGLVGLADSIRQHGVLNPITITPLSGVDGFRIVTGERRWRAAQKAGLLEIPALIREEVGDEAEKTAEQLVENLQREELTPLDKANAIKILKNTLGATNKEIGQRLGVSERTVGYLLDLLDLPESISEQVVSSPNRPADGNITEKHARFLRQLNDEPELQAQLAEKIKDEKLSSDDTGKLTKALRAHPDKREDIIARAIEELPTVLDISGDTDGPSPFSSGRAFAGLLERMLPTFEEVRISAISGNDLSAVEEAAQNVKTRVDRLLAEIRAARRVE